MFLHLRFVFNESKQAPAMWEMQYSYSESIKVGSGSHK